MIKHNQCSYFEKEVSRKVKNPPMGGLMYLSYYGEIASLVTSRASVSKSQRQLENIVCTNKVRGLLI